MARRKTVVGIDPGTTCGLSILSLSGEPIAVKSLKPFSKPELISEIASFGDPILIAVDVQRPPESVKYIAKKFRAKLLVPKAPMTVCEKRRLVKRYLQKWGLKLRDSHQRDALAAAIKAHGYIANKARKVEAALRRSGYSLSFDEIMCMVVRGMPIVEAIRVSEKAFEGRDLE